MTPADVLRRAADLIERDGWYHGPFTEDLDASFCPLLAFCVIRPHNFEATQRAQGTFSDAVGGDIAEWNDAQPDAEIVIAKLREVADELEATA